MRALNTTETLKVNSMRSGIDTSGDVKTEERNSEGGQQDGGRAVPESQVHRHTNWVALLEPLAHQKPAVHKPDVIDRPDAAQNDPAWH